MELTEFKCPNCGGIHFGTVNAFATPLIRECHGTDVACAPDDPLGIRKHLNPEYKPPCGWRGEWPVDDSGRD